MIFLHKKTLWKKYLMVGLSNESAYLLQIYLELFAGCPFIVQSPTVGWNTVPSVRYICQKMYRWMLQEKKCCFVKTQYFSTTTPILGCIYIYRYIYIYIYNVYLYHYISWYPDIWYPSWKLLKHLLFLPAKKYVTAMNLRRIQGAIWKTMRRMRKFLTMWITVLDVFHWVYGGFSERVDLQ